MPKSFDKRLAKLSTWRNAIKSSADPERAKRFLALLAATQAGDWLEKASAEQARILVSLLVGSRALSDWLIVHPNIVAVFDPEALKFPRRKQGLRQELEPSLAPLLASQDFGSALARVRQFRGREMLRVAARDLAMLGSLPDIVQEISDVADVCLNSVWDICYLQQTRRLGVPYHLDAQGRWQRTAGAVLGLGKLGGQDLNYSSDVDVIIVYSDEGEVHKNRPAKADTVGQNRKKSGSDRTLMTTHQFFNRLAEAFVAELTRVTPE